MDTEVPPKITHVPLLVVDDTYLISLSYSSHLIVV